ncbi:MAG: polysaccharide deacetylase family protein [Pseudomonadota bacterium]
MAGLLYTGHQIARIEGFQLFGELIQRGPDTRRAVALTFDDGPTRHTQTLLDALAAEDAKATFFLIGRDIERNPEQARAIAEAGHEIGNHSWNHRRLVYKAPWTIRRQIERTDAAIRDLGYDGPIAFRPPHGNKLIALPWVLSRMDRPNVMWSMDPDSVLGHTAPPEDMVRYITDTAQPGDIILLHGMYSGNASLRAALPDILRGLKAKGFALVTLDDLLRQEATLSTSPETRYAGAI